MEHPKAIGDRTTLAVMLVLEEAGYRLLMPFGENVRYDVVIEDGKRLSRLQCKTGRLRLGAVRFNTCSTYGHHRHPGEARRDYNGQVDYFAVYCPETTGVYLIPVDHLAAKTQAALRVDAPRNNQRRRIRQAADYEIGRVRVTARPGGRLGAGGSSA